MIGSITIRGFKSVVDQTIELGRLNVFVGANGAGKSVVLEAIGVLGAAADGRVDDAALLRRGVRPGVPALYKNAFAADKIPRFINLKALSDGSPKALYELSIDNPIKGAGLPWRFSHEKVALITKNTEQPFITRAPRGATFWGKSDVSQRFKPRDNTRSVADVPNPLGDPPEGVQSFFSCLRTYAIYDPQTPVLRGTEQEIAPLSPIGVHGGGLAEAVRYLLRHDWLKRDRDVKRRFYELLGWADSIGVTAPTADLISPNVPSAKILVRFRDRFMREGRNRLSAYDASEGALYVLFAYALIHHPASPRTLAIENIDHALHPRLARGLIDALASETKTTGRQLLVTTHNPLVLDGLDLRDDAIRLFTVDRNKKGHTLIERLKWSDALAKANASGLTLSQMWTQGLFGGVPNIF